MLCLLFAWLSFLWLSCVSLYDFVKDIEENESNKLEICLDSIVLGLISLKMVVFSCSGSLLSFGTFVIWIFVEIILVQILCLIAIKNWSINVCGFLLCIGSSGTYLIWGTLRKQMSLACLGMTLKEQHSRAESAKLEFDHDPREDIGCSSKCSNFWTFWCHSGTPPSQF